MADLTTAWANALFDHLFRQTDAPSLADLFLRLFEADPGHAQDFSNEVAGGTYTGQSVAGLIGAPATGVGTSTGPIDFPGMPVSTVTHWALCKSAAGVVDVDEAVMTGALVAPKTTAGGDTLEIATGDLDLVVA